MTHHVHFYSFPPPRSVSLRETFSNPPRGFNPNPTVFSHLPKWSLVVCTLPSRSSCPTFRSLRRQLPLSFASSLLVSTQCPAFSPSLTLSLQIRRFRVQPTERQPSPTFIPSLSHLHGLQSRSSTVFLTINSRRWRRSLGSDKGKLAFLVLPPLPLTLIVSSVRVARPSFHKVAGSETSPSGQPNARSLILAPSSSTVAYHLSRSTMSGKVSGNPWSVTRQGGVVPFIHRSRSTMSGKVSGNPWSVTRQGGVVPFIHRPLLLQGRRRRNNIDITSSTPAHTHTVVGASRSRCHGVCRQGPGSCCTIYPPVAVKAVFC
jgi:hypothetical protein